MARLPGVRNNHPDQLRHLNLASLAPIAMPHANLRTTMLPRVERVVQHPQLPRTGRSGALRQERSSVAVLNLVAISSTVLRWPAATLIMSSYASSLVRVSRRPFTP
jgi:hypothetical protein